MKNMILHTKVSRRVYAESTTPSSPDDNMSDTDSESITTSSTDSHSTRFKGFIVGKGCLSWLERIPLPCKLVFMNTISLAGAAIIGAILLIILFSNMMTDNTFLSYERLCVHAGNVVHEMSEERAHSNMYLTLNASTEYRTKLEMERILTNSHLQTFMSYTTRFSPNTLFSNYMFSNLSSLATVRAQIDNISISGSDCISNYTSIIHSILNFVLKHSLDNTSGAVNDLVSFNMLLGMKEAIGRIRGFGVSITTNKGFASVQEYVQLVKLVEYKQSLHDVLMAEASAENIVILNAALSSPEVEAVNNITTILINDPYDLLIIDSIQWLNLTTAMIVKLNEVKDVWATMFEASVLSKINISITYVVVTFMLLLLFFLLALVANIILTKTIVGPWQRMLDLQANTISKFVPTGFLSMLKCSSLSDIWPGKSIRKEITIVFTDIRGFTSLSEKMAPEDTFRFINQYLENMGPHIRRHRGFIDKYMGDGIVAIFHHPHDAILACIAMQLSIIEQNKDPSMPSIQVGMGIHTGTCIIGAVGESHRMDGTIIGDSVNLASRLEALTKKFKSKILITRETLEKCKRSAVTNVKNRYLGRVQVKGKKKSIDIHEIFDGTEHEKQTHRFEFVQAVQLMQDNKFDEALTLFRSMSEKLNDPTSTVMVQYCEVLKRNQDRWNGVFEMEEK